jgi:archaeal preflagellin peptidase FlaK
MTETGTLLDIIRLVVGIAILSYASYTDIKTRRASNMLWVIMGVAGGILLIIQYFTIGFGDKTMFLIFIPIMIVLVYFLFQLRLIFGGADAKALMALSILVPLPPIINNIPLWKNSIMPAPWVIFSNSVILFLFIPLSLLIFNVAKRNPEFPFCLLGYKMSVAKAKEKFVWPLEKLKDGKRKFMYMPKDFDTEKELEEFERRGIKEIWVTPKIPFMIPLLAGFIASFILGDILFYLINAIRSIL